MLPKSCAIAIALIFSVQTAEIAYPNPVALHTDGALHCSSLFTPHYRDKYGCTELQVTISAKVDSKDIKEVLSRDASGFPGTHLVPLESFDEEYLNQYVGDFCETGQIQLCAVLKKTDPSEDVRMVIGDYI